MKDYYIGNHIKSIDDSIEIGKGGEAHIYGIDKQHALKEIKSMYRDKKKPKIEALLQHYTLVEGSLKKKLGYPLELAHEVQDGSFCGFSMPLFYSCQTMYDIPYILFSGAFGRDDLHDRQAFSIVRKLFSDLNRIHQCKMVVGDLNPKNILVSEDDEVYWVDVDSFGIPGHPTRVQGMKGYVCPYVLESPKDLQGNYTHNQGSDIYALAIVAFKFLVGCHPFEVPCDSPLSKIAAMKENLNYFTLIQGKGRYKRFCAIQGLEYQKTKERLHIIKKEASDIYQKLYDILYLGKRTLKVANKPRRQKPKKQQPRKKHFTKVVRTPGLWKYPDPPEFKLFLKRYNITLP